MEKNMFKVKLKDLELAMEYIKKNVYSEYIEFDVNETTDSAMSMSFIDRTKKVCKIFLYESGKNITPEVRVISKLYKSE